MGCGTQLVKIILFVTNFFFLLCGVGLIVFGALTQSGYQKYLEFLGELGAYQAPPIIAIVVGSIVFIIAFAGCCGAIRESNCLMMTYAILMSTILIVTVGIVVAVLTNQDEFKTHFSEGMKKSMMAYGHGDDAGKEATKSWDILQKELKCCGIESYKEWIEPPVSKLFVPTSCCINEFTGCNAIPTPLTVFDQGCLQKAIDDIGLKYLTIAGSLFGAALLLAIIFSCCLAARFRRKVYNS